MSNKQRYDVDIHFNSNISTIKEMTTEANKLRTVIAKMEAEGVKSVAQKNQLDGYKKQEAAISRVLKKVKEQTSHMIRGSVEYNESVEKSLRTFNANTAKAVKIQEKLNAAVREQVQLEDKLARASNKAANEEKKKSLWSRTKRALGQSFLEAPLYAASFAIMNQASQSLQTYIEIDKTLTRIGIVTGRSAESMKQFAIYAEEAGRALGVTGKTFAEASLTFLQQGGLAADYANSLAESSIKLANITGKSSSDTSEYITAIANSFKLLETEGSSAGGHIADMLASLDAASGSSADEIAQAFERSASSFASAGFSAEQASAMIATVSETTRQSAEMVGTGFKTMIGNLADVVAGKGTDEITSKLQKVAQDFGLSYSMIDKNTGNMKEVPQILNEVANLYNNTNDLAAKNALVEAVAGKEQRDRFIALITNQQRYNELLGDAQNSAGAADEANKRYMDSAAAKIEVIKNEWEALTMKLVNSDSFKWFLDQIARLISQINGSISGFGDAVAQVAKVAIPLTLALKSGSIKERLKGTGPGKFLYGEDGKTPSEQLVDGATRAGNVLVESARQAGAALTGSTITSGIDQYGSPIGPQPKKTLRGRFADAVRNFSPFRETSAAGGGKFFAGLKTGKGLLGIGKALGRGAIGGGLFAGVSGVMDIASAWKSNESTANKVKDTIGNTALIAGSFFGPLGMAAGYAIKFGLAMSKSSVEAEKLRNQIEKNKATFKEAFTSNPGQVDDLVHKVTTLSQGTQEYTDAANELAKIAPQLSLGQDEYGNAILDSADAIKEYVKAVEKEIDADKRAANTKAAKKARKMSETAYDAYNNSDNRQDQNTYLQSLTTSLKDELISEIGNMKLTDDQKKFARSGVAKLISGENAVDYFETLKTEGIQAFFAQFQDQFIIEGKKGFDAQFAVNSIVGNIDWSKTTFKSLVDDISSYSNMTAEELNKSGYLQPIIDSLSSSFNDLTNTVKSQRFDELASQIVPKNDLFNPSQFKSMVVNARNSSGALKQAISIMLEGGRIANLVQKSMDDKDGINDDEFKEITKALADSDYFRLKYKNSFGRTAAKKLRKNKDYSNLKIDVEDKAGESINVAGYYGGYGAGDGSGKTKEQEMQDFIKDALDKLAYSRAVREGIVADEQAKLDAMSASDAGYIKQEESVANAKKAIVAQAEAERAAIIQVGKSHPTLIKTAAYQEALNKANQDVAKSYKDVKESLQKLALDKAYQTVFGTADLEGYKERYKIKQELLDISLDSYEQIVEKATLELEIQKEIDNATNEVYKSNLRILESKLKTTKLNKAIIDGLQGQLKLMKALNSENDNQLKLTRTSSGSFRYLNTGFDNSQKEQALAVSRQNEAESIQKYREQSAKITDLEAQILQYSSSTDPDKKSKVPMLQKTLDYLKKMVFGDDGYAQQIQKNKVLSALIEEGRMDIARDLNSGKITSDKAISYLPKKIADAIKQSYRSEVDAGSAAGNAALIDSNGNIVNTNTILNRSTNNLNTAMKNLQSEMAKIQNLKIDPSSIAGIADAVARSIANTLGDGKDKENPKKTTTPKVFDSDLVIGKNGRAKSELRPSGTFGNNIFANTDDTNFSAFKTTPGKQDSAYAKATKSLQNIARVFKNDIKNDKVSSVESLKKYKSIWQKNNTVEQEFARVSQRIKNAKGNELKNLTAYRDALGKLIEKQSDKREASREDYIKTHLNYYESLKQDIKNFMGSKDYKKYGLDGYEGTFKKKTIKSYVEWANKNSKNLSSKEKDLYNKIKEIYVGLSDPARTLQSYFTQMEGSENWGAAMNAVNSSAKDEKHKWNQKDHANVSYFPKITEIGTAIKGKTAFFDTGGYTGDFSGGKVAVLHEKELVLNKLDTENMLKAVQIVREIPQLAAAIPNMSSSSTSSNQNITINANFPNASSSDEIKKALESLSSKALQYQYRTKSY